MLAAMGFEALATTSLGLANTLGSATVSLDAIIENCRMIAEATDSPSMPI
jgi:2-methylisocitrate lyase-like PEP mutase family enzyme